MFFESSPLISQSASPLPVDSLIMRASFVSQGSTIKQTLSTDDIPETILFNKESLPSQDITVDLVTGEVTAVKDFAGMATLSVIALREGGGGGSPLWGVFVEVYDSGSGQWIAAEDSLRPISLSRDLEDEVRPIDYTLSVEISAGQKFRWRHYTTDASKNISIVAYAPSNGIPGSAAAIMSFWGIKP